MAKAKKKKPSLSPAEKAAAKIKRVHIAQVRGIFRDSGFDRVPSFADRQFTYDGTTSDFDDAFVLENILVLTEYTTAQESGISSHIKPKKILYDKINADPAAFINFLKSKFDAFKSAFDEIYHDHHYRVVIMYCSLNSVKPSLKLEVPSVSYLDYGNVQYFKTLTRTIRHSTRNEILSFCKIPESAFGPNLLTSSKSADSYSGSILPEGHSNFPKGHKIVSFYVNPEAILHRAYVLRRDGWRDGGSLYQRMISKNKIEKIRKYLTETKRVFINNIIVTLPDDTKILSDSGNTVDMSTLQQTEPVVIQLPESFNSIGIIDGQHRVFAYYEGGSLEAKIKGLRKLQNLLVTGIIYPHGVSEIERSRFEASLFLEINSTQTNARSDLKQAIGLIVNPFASDSLGQAVIDKLNIGAGPLATLFQRYYYERNKLRTTSVVSYGLRPLVKLEGTDSFFAAWSHADKSKLKEGKSDTLRDEYVDFAANTLDTFMAAIKSNLPNQKWAVKTRKNDGILSTTSANGFIFCLRKAIETKEDLSFDSLRKNFSFVKDFKFDPYTSSHYNKLGETFIRKLSRHPHPPPQQVERQPAQHQRRGRQLPGLQPLAQDQGAGP